MRYFEIINEAMPLKTAKRYRKAWDPSQYKQLFARFTSDPQAYRIYLPIETSNEIEAKVRIPADIQNAVTSAGFTIEDYKEGVASKGTQKIRLGKVLNRIDPKLKQKFDSDPQRKAQNKNSTLEVVISRHPYDVAGMSHDRGWSSCMSLADGSNKQYVLKDVKGGTIIAYLIDSQDRNINKPKARLLIKPFVNTKTDEFILMHEGSVYGTAPKSFISTVDKWLESVNEGRAAGLYCLQKGLYNDGDNSSTMFGNPTSLSTKEAKLWIDHGQFSKVYNLVKDNTELLMYALRMDSDNIKIIKNKTPKLINELVLSVPFILRHVNVSKLYPETIVSLIEDNGLNIRFFKNPTFEQQKLALKENLTSINYIIGHIDTGLLEYVVKVKPNVIEWDNAHIVDRPDLEKLFKLAVRSGKINLKNALHSIISGLTTLTNGDPRPIKDVEFLKYLLKLNPDVTCDALDNAPSNWVLPDELFDFISKKYPKSISKFTRVVSLEQRIKLITSNPSTYDNFNHTAKDVQKLIELIPSIPKLFKYMYYDIPSKQEDQLLKKYPELRQYVR